MSLWPFRTGNDDAFQSRPKQETIYDAIQNSEMPQHRYEIEVSKYNEWRWRRGMVQSIGPATLYGAIAGFVLGFRNSRLEGRYLGRWTVLSRYTMTGAMVGLASSSIHHFLVVRNRYEEKFFYPMIAGAGASFVVTTATQMGTITTGAIVGSFSGCLYTLCCMAMKYYHNRKMRIFLEQQRQMQVPVHKLSPELQPMYRAFLFDNRPMEEEGEVKRRAMMLARSDDDMRLDAQAFLNNMTPEVFDWVSFPDWWPLKYPFQTEEQQLLLDRQRADEVRRRTDLMLSHENGHWLKRRNRAAGHREV